MSKIWGLTDPVSSGGSILMTQNKPISKIVIHHSASRPDTEVSEIEAWHIARGFNGIGYHKVITHDGIIHNTRPENIVPASVKGKNKGTLAVCLTGNFDTDPLNNFQIISLEVLIKDWKGKYGEHLEVVGHMDLAPTACPGQALYNWIQKYNEKVKSGEFFYSTI